MKPYQIIGLFLFIAHVTVPTLAWGKSVPKRTLQSDLDIAPTKYQSLMGVEVVNSRSGYVIGGALGFNFIERQPIYLGPEVNFSLHGDHSILKILACLWYEIRIYKIPALRTFLGLSLGPAFNTDISYIGTNPLVVLFDGGVSHAIDDLFSLRARIRQGFIGSEFMVMGDLGVSFQFF